MASSIAHFQHFPIKQLSKTRTSFARELQSNLSFCNTKQQNRFMNAYIQQSLLPSSLHRGTLSYKAMQQDHDHPSNGSPAFVVHELYEAINYKNYAKFEELISDDCCLHDFSYSKPFHGKKEVVGFFTELGNVVGKNTKFIITDDYEDGTYTATMTWHIEWRGHFIPLSRGFAHYECQIHGDKMTIRKGRLAAEWPIKPGDLSLKALKMIESLFDKFPEPAERFLQDPYGPIKWLLKIYQTFMEPVVKRLLFPVITFYSKFWDLFLHLASYLYVLLVKNLK